MAAVQENCPANCRDHFKGAVQQTSLEVAGIGSVIHRLGRTHHSSSGASIENNRLFTNRVVGPQRFESAIPVGLLINKEVEVLRQLAFDV
jgi:hypothetical protein